MLIRNLGGLEIKKLFASVLILFSGAYAALSAVDLSSVGVSARPLGMGGMFLTVQGDPASLIHNPAGVSRIKQTKFFSSSWRTLQEVNYLDYGIAIPAEGMGVFGLSYLSRGVNNIPITDALVMNGGAVDYSGIEKASYRENLFIATYARDVAILDNPYSFGVNAKFFNNTTSGYSKGNATGFNLDLGSQFQITEHLDIGLKYQNLLSGGGSKLAPGSMLWDTGEVSGIDSYMMVGLSNRTFQRNLLVGLDIKKNTSRTMYPATLHFGMEWHPLDPLFLRLGAGQSLIAPDSSDSGAMKPLTHLTGGFGLNLYDWRFDYAYRPDSEIKDLSAHIFSLSYVGFEPCDKLSEITQNITTDNEQPGVQIFTPKDRTVTSSEFVLVSGKVFNGDRYILNDEEYPVSKNGLFGQQVELALGINDITAATKGSGKQTIKVLRLAHFEDIADSVYKEAIVNLSTLGYVQGDYQDKFNPQRPVSRGEMANLIMKFNKLSRPVQLRGVISDVDVLSAYGVLRGFPDGLMRPDAKLTKGQLAMTLARLQNLPIAEQGKFNYLNREHWADSAINALIGSGLYSAEDFQPKGEFVTKGELAAYFNRLPLIQERLQKLYNFEEVVVNEDISTQAENFFFRKPGSEAPASDEDIFNQMIQEDQPTKPVTTITEGFSMMELNKPKVIKAPVVAKTKPLIKKVTATPVDKITRKEFLSAVTKTFGVKSTDSRVVELKKPGQLTRSLAVVVINRLANIEPVNPKTKPYADVDTKIWAYKQISAAKAAGIISEAPKFNPFGDLDSKTLNLWLKNAKK